MRAHVGKTFSFLANEDDGVLDPLPTFSNSNPNNYAGPQQHTKTLVVLTVIGDGTAAAVEVHEDDSGEHEVLGGGVAESGQVSFITNAKAISVELTSGLAPTDYYINMYGIYD